MNRMRQRVKLFVLSCLFLTVKSHTGKILPPQNLTLTWLTEFQVELTWQPPQPSMTSCEYEVTTMVHQDQFTTDKKRVRASPWTGYIVMEGGNLLLSVRTGCNETFSEPAVIHVTYPELVKNLNCYIQSRKHTHCSWQPGTHVPDLRFYYMLVTQGLDSDSSNDSMTLQECSSYDTTGCNLQAACKQEIYISFNGTGINGLVRNTFLRELRERPPPPTWTIHEVGNKFHISWEPLDTCSSTSWNFIIRYTECNVKKKMETKETSLLLPRTLRCPYCMTIEARSEDEESLRSTERCFDPHVAPDGLVYAAVIIPLLFACLAALAFVYCRKNRRKLFPKVPQPRDLLSDISNNNKSDINNLYIPAEEEENCKITLVIDPLINKPEC